jgi:hypothetical protein
MSSLRAGVLPCERAGADVLPSEGASTDVGELPGERWPGASSPVSQPPAGVPAPPSPPFLLLKSSCPKSGGRPDAPRGSGPTPAAAPPRVLLLAVVVDFAPQLPI